ncbi:mucin-4-like [Crassostrea angulata]|uniref:mucin-4-like n=1 Tax=Magallana angulata TaxID=2784310 RepID=UPI0022B20576|nr:mucin-4-like [Crassostrea angulata]
MTAYTTTEISTTTFKTFLSKTKPLKTTNFTSKPRLSFDTPLEITGQDPTGIPLDGLTSSLFGQFFLTKVDLEKELDLQKDVEYIPNKVSNFFNLEDPYQSYQPEVSVSVYTIGESDVTTANPTNNGEMLASSTIPPPIKSTTSFAFTNLQKTTTPEPIRPTSKPTTTTSQLTTSQLTTTHKLTTTRKPTTTHKPVTTSQLTTTTIHKITTTLKPTTTQKPTTTLELSTTRKPAISLKFATTTASKLTTTREPTTTSKPVTRLPRVYRLPTVYQPPIPPPIPPLIRNSNFFSKFSKIIGTRKRPMQTATAPSPYKSLQTSSGKINNAVPSTKRTNKSKNTKFIVSKNNTRVKTKVTPTSTTAKSTTIKATTQPTTMESSTTMATTTSIKPTKSSTTTTYVKPSTTTASTTSRSTTSRVTTTTTQLSPTKATSTTIVSITTKPTTSSTSRQDHGVDDGVDEETVLSPVSIPKVVPYLIFFPDEKTNSQGGYSKQQPSHLDIKKPKIVFEPKKTLLTPKLKPRVDAGQMVDQSKFFGNSSSNINSNSSSNIHQIISVMVKDIISTKIKINDREPTSIPIVTAGNRIKNITEIYGKSSSNFKVSQFNSTVIPKDNGKIYMEEKLPTFEPYTPTNDTNSTNNKMFRDVKNVVHHNFVLDSLIENMANFLKNDESKIQFHLNEDHHDKKANNVLNMKEQIKERIDSSIMSNGDKLDLPGAVSDLNITESIAPQRTQSESQARLDLQNTVLGSNERFKTFERKNKNLNQGKLIRWFNINSKVYRTTPASDTVTEVTSRIQGTTPTSFPVLQTIPPFPTHAIPLRPTSQSTSLKSTLISLLPPPIPSKNLFYHRPGQNPADLPHPTVKVQGTSTQHVISTTKSKTILADKRNPEWPDTPSSFPLSEHYFSLQALKPTDGHTTSASERLTTTTPTTKQTTTKQTTKKQTTTPQLSTVTPIFNMPGLSLGVTTPINKISQLFFPPDFTQKKSLTEIINSDPRIVEGVYTKDVYPPSREQINASDVILSTPYQLKDPVSRVPLFLKSTPSSILTTSSQRPLSEKVHKTRSSSPSLPTIHRVIKLMPSRKRNPTLQPNKGSESAILEKTSENPKPDLTLGSERSSSGIGNSKIQLSPAFTFSNGSALTTNVHRNTKEVRTFRNVGKDILKEIFKSPKVKKHEILSGKVKLPRGKNAVILDIGLLNKLMDTFKQWLTSMRLLVVEK